MNALRQPEDQSAVAVTYHVMARDCESDERHFHSIHCIDIEHGYLRGDFELWNNYPFDTLSTGFRAYLETVWSADNG